MRLMVVLTGVILVSGALAGCIENATDKETSFTLNRQVHIQVNKANIDAAEAADEFDPYLFIKSTFVVTVREKAIEPSAATVTYEDRDGNSVTRPLTDFTTKTTLEPGDEVRVDDAHLLSPATLTFDGSAVASRTRVTPQWWVAGGYPVGITMEPGSVLSYAMDLSASETMALTDIRAKEEPYVIERAAMDMALNFAGKLRLEYEDAAQSLVAEETHQARPISWSMEGTAKVPVTLEVQGEHTGEGRRVDAGLQILDATQAVFDAHGKLWMNESGSPVRMDLEGGKVKTDADMIAWLTGLDEVTPEQFSCAGKTREDACRPTEANLDSMRHEETLEADEENLDGMPWMIEEHILRNVTAFLAEDLLPGDLVRLDVDLDARDFPDYASEPGMPETLVVDLEAQLKAVGEDRVTVGAGSFDAIKVTQTFRQRLEIGEINQDGEVVFKGVTIDPGLIESNLWLEKGTFTPLRIQGSTPLDIGEILGDLIDAVGEEMWADAPIERITGDNVQWTIAADTDFELVEYSGKAQFAPWLVLLGLNGMWAGPAAYAASSGFGSSYDHATPAYPEEPYYDPDSGESGWTEPTPTPYPEDEWTYEEDGTQFVWLYASEDDEGKYAFMPTEVFVEAGRQVDVSLYVGGGVHNINFPDFAAKSELISEGEEAVVSFTPTEPGKYVFFCEPHQSLGMTGTLIVE